MFHEATCIGDLRLLPRADIIDPDTDMISHDSGTYFLQTKEYMLRLMAGITMAKMVAIRVMTMRENSMGAAIAWMNDFPVSHSPSHSLEQLRRLYCTWLLPILFDDLIAIVRQKGL